MNVFTVANFDEENVSKQEILKLIRLHRGHVEDLIRQKDYYDGKHAIQDRQTRGKDAPNSRVTVNFAKYTSDISTSYFISNPITYESTTGEDIEPLLVAFDKAHVDDTDADNAFEASVYGEAYEYVYAAEDAAEVRTKNLSAQSTFLIHDTSIEERVVGAVYYRRIADATTGKTTYSANVVTRHYIYDMILYDQSGARQTGKVERRNHYFGDVPIVGIKNNHECFGDFAMSMSLIDAYNTIFSDRVDNLDSIRNAILVLYGTILGDEGEAGDEARERLKRDKLLELADKQTMGAEWITFQLDQNGVETLQKAVAKDILRLAYVPDFSDENFAANSSGVAIAFKCLLLEWATKTKERYYRQALRQRIKLFCTYLGLKQILIDADSIVPQFTRALPVNNLEIAQTISLLSGHISDRKLISLYPGIEDPDAELAALKKEQAEKAKLQQSIFDIRPNTPPPDDDDKADDEA